MALQMFRRQSFAFTTMRYYCKLCAAQRNQNHMFLLQKAVCSDSRTSFIFSVSINVRKNLRYKKRPQVELEVHQQYQYNHEYYKNQTASFSSKPAVSVTKIKTLMVATYISAAIGGILLVAIAYRFYGRFKKRARGIEELDVPLFGRRCRAFCRYRGYILPSDVVHTVVDEIPWFEVRQDDIWVVSFPKAGTTWLQEIVYLISSDFDYEKAKISIEDRFPYLEFPCPGHRVVAQNPSPRFIKTHLPFSLLPKQLEEKKPKIIYIARNPKDTAVSLLAFIKLLNYYTFLGSVDDFAQLFVDGTVFYGPWLKHVEEGWERRRDENVLFVTYEELHKDFIGTVSNIAKFLEKPVTESQLEQLKDHCSFSNMQSNASVNYSWQNNQLTKGQFMRKGEVGDWKNHFTLEMAAKFNAMSAGLSSRGLHFIDS